MVRIILLIPLLTNYVNAHKCISRDFQHASLNSAFIPSSKFSWPRVSNFYSGSGSQRHKRDRKYCKSRNLDRISILPLGAVKNSEGVSEQSQGSFLYKILCPSSLGLPKQSTINNTSGGGPGQLGKRSSSQLSSKILDEDIGVVASSEQTSYEPTKIDSIDSISTIQSTTSNNQIPPEFIPILILCWCVTLLSALDRVAMSIAILPISTEFQYTETIKGSISSAVSYGYGAAILPIGLAVSVVSSRNLMIVGVLLWSAATIGTPLMAEFSENLNNNGFGVVDEDYVTQKFILPLVAIRAIMGAAEAVVLPTMQRILATWVPAEKKATVLAIVLSGFQFGTVSAYLVSPWVMDIMTGLDGGGGVNGWRGMFYIYGFAGLLWLVPWWFIAKDSPSTTFADADKSIDCEETLVNNMTDDDASLVLNECPVPYDDRNKVAVEIKYEPKLQQFLSLLQSAPWSKFATSRGVWGMTLAHAAKNFFLYNLLAWTPTFYSEQYGLNVKESALYSILPSICGMIGGLTAGNSADYFLSKILEKTDEKLEAVEKRTNVRKLFQVVALFGPAACLSLLSNIPDEVRIAQILLGGAVGLQAFDAAGFGAATQEKAGNRWAGLLYSLTSLPGVMIGSVSVSVTGQLLDMMPDNASGWTAVFQLNSAVCIVGALSFLLFYDSKKEFD
mmetsp:Transcript_29513/g.61465  ORF Transcript_29513/g.61465 Transcript_29513/m.61465 type:complete len:673 (-) Transcript_29513:69-2087(-)